MKVKNRNVVPIALRQVWEWRDAVYRETEGMTTTEALTSIHNRAEEMRKAFGLKISAPVVGAPCVAEDRDAYGTIGVGTIGVKPKVKS